MIKLSVNRPMTILVIVIIIIVLGAVAYMNMTTDLLPSINLPYIVVITTYPGAAPEEVEAQVTEPIESALASTSNLKNITSTSSENVSMVTLEFVQSADLDALTVEVSQSLNSLSGGWDSKIGSPYMIKMNPDMLPVMVAAVKSDGLSYKEMGDMAKDTLIPKLETIPGVASVSSQGIVEEQIKVEIDQDKINKINSLILKSVDGDLDEARDALREAQGKIDDGYDELDSEYKKNSSKISDAEKALNSGQNEIDSNRKKLTDAEQQLKAGEDELNSQKDAYNNKTKPEVEATIKDLKAQKADLESQKADLESQKKDLETKKQGIETLKAKKAELEGQKAQLEAAIAAMPDGPEKTALQTKLAEVTAGLAVVSNQLVEAEAALPQIEEGLSQINAGISQIDDGISQLDAGIAQAQAGLDSAEQQFAAAENEINTQKAALEEGKSQLDAGQAEIDSNRSKVSGAKSALDKGVSEAKDKLSDAQDMLDENQKMFDDAEETAHENANIDGLITIEMVSQILGAQDFNMPAGYVDDNGINSVVKVGDEVTTVEDMEDLLLFDLDMEYVGEVRLGDVAKVYYDDNSEDMYAKLNAEEGVVIIFTKQSTYSTSEVADSIKNKFDELESQYPGLQFVPMMDQGIYIDMIITTVINNLLMGAVLAVIVLLIFLRSIKPTLIVAASIPISVIFAIALMYFSGVTLNIISLAGLALGVGMLVDNSIVVIENTYRLRQLGVSPFKAAYQGAKEMAPAITASTITTISVFLPIMFTNGLTRQLFTDMALTITYSLVASLLVALTVVPAMSSSVLSKVKTGESAAAKFGTAVQNGYAKALKWALKFKPIVIIGVIVAFGLSAWGAYQNGAILIPPMDSSQMTATFKFAPEVPKDDQYEAVDDISKKILDIDEVESIGVIDASNSASMAFLTSGGGMNEYSVYINLYDGMTYKNTNALEKVEDIVEENSEHGMTAALSGSNFDVSQLTGVSGIRVTVKGNDYDKLMQTAEDIAGIVSGVEGTTNTKNGIGDTENEIRISVDKDAAMKKGLTVAQVYQSVAMHITSGNTATYMYENGKDFPVVVVTGDALSMEADRLGDIEIDIPEKPAADENAEMTFDFDEAAFGDSEDEDTEEDKDKEENKDDEEEEEEKTVLLSEIASIERGKSPSSINRENQLRTINVTSDIASGYNVSQVSEKVEAALQGYTAPEDVNVEFTGESNQIFDTVYDFAYMMAVAVILIYLIMVVQFQSLKSPFIVMFTIPLAFTGGLLALVICHYEISMVALLGVLLLAGIVVNNGIVLVDTINRYRLSGMERHEAIVKAGQTRMRPVLMTAFTTIFGLLTMTLGMGIGSEMLQPMAAVVVGGLAYATALTLFFVPIVYDAINKKELKRRDVDSEK